MRLIPLRASDTSPARYLRASDTSPAGYLRASDTSSAKYLRASATSSARLILSIYPPARPPPSSLSSARLIPPRICYDACSLSSARLLPPRVCYRPPPPSRRSLSSARLIPPRPPRDTSARLIPFSAGDLRASDTSSARLILSIYPPARPPPPPPSRTLLQLRASDTSARLIPRGGDRGLPSVHSEEQAGGHAERWRHRPEMQTI